MGVARILRRSLLSIALLGLPAVGFAQQQTKSAVWWNASEAGWGLFIADQGNVLAPYWFTNDVDGEPVWFAAATTLQADGSYRGNIFRITGVPLAQITGQAADPETVIGSAILRFNGDSGVAFEYTVNGVTQSKTLSRFPFGDKDVACTATASNRAAASNYSDIWWNPTSSGWGVHISHVDNDLYTTWYTYDTDREPVFYQGVTRRQADGSFSGQLYRTKNGTPYSQINGAVANPGADEVGTLTLRFSDGQNASYSYTIGNVTQTKSIQRFVFGSSTNVCTVKAFSPGTGGNNGGAGADECYPPLAVGDRYRIRSTPGTGGVGETDVEVIGTGTYQGRPVFQIRYRPVPQTSAGDIIEFVEQTPTERIYYGSEGYIPEVQARGTTRFEPPVRTPRSTPVGAQGRLIYKAITNYTANGVSVASEINFDETYHRVGTENQSSPAGSFSNACKFETTLRSDVSISTQGFTNRVVIDARATQWAHPLIGGLRGTSQSTSSVTVSGSPFPIPPTITNSSDVSEIVSATIGGRSYP